MKGSQTSIEKNYIFSLENNFKAKNRNSKLCHLVSNDFWVSCFMETKLSTSFYWLKRMISALYPYLLYPYLPPDLKPNIFSTCSSKKINNENSAKRAKFYYKHSTPWAIFTVSWHYYAMVLSPVPCTTQYPQVTKL